MLYLCKKHLKIKHQDISFDNTIYGEMLATKQYILDLEANIRRLEQDMKHAEGEELEKILETYNRLSSKYDRDNGYSYESEITGVLKGLGFGPEDYDRHINTLSGGQKMRIALGRLLLTRPDIIILDEPTNHLDASSREELEKTLLDYSGTMLIVSHDRYFINKIADRILLLTNNGVKEYLGNYDYYLERTTAEKSGAVPTENKKDKKEKTQNDYFFQKQKQSEERKRQTKLKKAEAEIERLDEEIAKTQELLSSEEVAADYEKLMELSKLLENLQKQQEEQYEIWEELESMAE